MITDVLKNVSMDKKQKIDEYYFIAINYPTYLQGSFFFYLISYILYI